MATPRRKTSVMSHPVTITFLILAIIAAMSMAAEVLKPLALSVLLAFALTPVSRALERQGLPRGAAVVLTVLLALGTLGGIGYIVGEQLTTLADKLPEYQDNINDKLDRLKPEPERKSALQKAQAVANQVAAKLDTPPIRRQVTDVRIIAQPTFRERLQTAVGPYLEFLGVGSFVLVLVLFMMLHREDLRDRIVALFGYGRVSLTTRTMDEIGQRISRYLATFAAMNTGFGLVIGLGLWVIGVPNAVLWGCLAALMRFIPYVGPAVAFALPTIFAIAYFPDWYHPLGVVVLFGLVETALNSFLEPVIYGKTTGASALGLLVAAMFWTWLWGLMGLLLSTPLTVCLAVLGKSVPALSVFATLLGEEADLEPDVRLYQRLVALDRDGAAEVVDEALKSRPRVEVFDALLVPALARAERDAATGILEDSDLAFIWRVVAEIVDELEGMPEITLASAEASARPIDGAPVLLGVAANDTADAVVLRMFAQLLDAVGLSLEMVTDAANPLALAERVEQRAPALVVLSHLPPMGLTEARYQVRRLRARFSDLPILVGRWGATGSAASAAERLAEVGASLVVFSLADARDHILKRFTAASATPPGAGVGPDTEPRTTLEPSDQLRPEPRAETAAPAGSIGSA